MNVLPGIPLAMKLKKRTHWDLAFAQDLIVMELYSSFPKSVLHGETAIWRCFKGNRFSGDIDVYFSSADRSRVGDLVGSLRAKGVTMLKFKDTANTIFVKFCYSAAIVSLEIALRAVKGYTVKPFEMIDGSFMLVNTLTPEDLILEKASAYKGRRKVRDLYDIFFLINLVVSRERVVDSLRQLIQSFRRPIDERELKTIIISGTIPTVERMLEAIEKWVG